MHGDNHNRSDQNPDIPFKDIVELANDIVIVTKAAPLDEPGPEIVYVNQAFTRMTGYSAEEVIGRTPRMLQGRETNSETSKIIRQALEKQEPVRVLTRNYTRDDTMYWLDISINPLHDCNGLVTHYVAIQRDVTEYYQQHLQLKVEAREDALTQLYNRRSFDETLQAFHLTGARTGNSFCLLLMDLDNFKEINDGYGHPVGDKLLLHAAQLLRKTFRNEDVISRVGGDEFAVLMPECTLDAAINAADRLLVAASNTPFTQGTLQLHLRYSIGAVCCEAGQGTVVTMLDQADKTMYRAKASGGHRVRH